MQLPSSTPSHGAATSFIRLKPHHMRHTLLSLSTLLQIALLALLVLLTPSAHALLTPAEWRNQSIYQLLTDRFALPPDAQAGQADLTTYCGGTFKGIESRLDYIQGMGFTAIWISPVVDNIAGGYHGYWARDLTRINAHFGSVRDLQDLVAALHARGMYLMVDVVVNHVGYRDGDLTQPDYSTYKPFNSASHYHHPACLISDWNDQAQVENCWLATGPDVSLPDLRTEDNEVAGLLNAWVADLVKTYNVDGFRIDTAREVAKDFFPPFQTAASGAHMLGEVFTGDTGYVCDYQKYMSGLLNYPAYFLVKKAFSTPSQPLGDLARGITDLQQKCKDVSLLGNFLENHDNDRFPSLAGGDAALVRNAIAFTMLNDGIPILYYGQEQGFKGLLSDGGDPHVREILWPSEYATDAPLYVFVARLNRLRSHLIGRDASYTTTPAVPIFDGANDTVMALRKGRDGAQLVAVFTSAGSRAGGNGSAATITLTAARTGFPPNAALVDVASGACSTTTTGGGVLTTDARGDVRVTLEGGEPRVLVLRDVLQAGGGAVC